MTSIIDVPLGKTKYCRMPDVELGNGKLVKTAVISETNPCERNCGTYARKDSVSQMESGYLKGKVLLVAK